MLDETEDKLLVMGPGKQDPLSQTEPWLDGLCHLGLSFPICRSWWWVRRDSRPFLPYHLRFVAPGRSGGVKRL